jgi:hypothetical protein
MKQNQEKSRITVYLVNPNVGIVYEGKDYFEKIQQCDRAFAQRMIDLGKGTLKPPTKQKTPLKEG